MGREPRGARRATSGRSGDPVAAMTASGSRRRPPARTTAVLSNRSTAPTMSIRPPTMARRTAGRRPRGGRSKASGSCEGPLWRLWKAVPREVAKQEPSHHAILSVRNPWRQSRERHGDRVSRLTRQRAQHDVRRRADRQPHLRGARIDELVRDLHPRGSGAHHQHPPAGERLGIAIVGRVQQLPVEALLSRPGQSGTTGSDAYPVATITSSAARSPSVARTVHRPSPPSIRSTRTPRRISTARRSAHASR